jgi:hypothetical protein
MDHAAYVNEHLLTTGIRLDKAKTSGILPFRNASSHRLKSLQRRPTGAYRPYRLTVVVGLQAGILRLASLQSERYQIFEREPGRRGKSAM